MYTAITYLLTMVVGFPVGQGRLSKKSDPKPTQRDLKGLGLTAPHTLEASHPSRSAPFGWEDGVYRGC